MKEEEVGRRRRPEGSSSLKSGWNDEPTRARTLSSCGNQPSGMRGSVSETGLMVSTD